ncbi:hypothetical protein SAY86_018857 [Trapa natans]|uniref:Uncharacterized protein n=1 Tax=Trapa natans TaxID=22666 RepID=A0AAN7QYF7_TRANT|nr:hypothetical protein SAY86_018857 [Trapa natans]
MMKRVRIGNGGGGIRTTTLQPQPQPQLASEHQFIRMDGWLDPGCAVLIISDVMASSPEGNSAKQAHSMESNLVKASARILALKGNSVCMSPCNLQITFHEACGDSLFMMTQNNPNTHGYRQGSDEEEEDEST